jgi:hypothetical protein
MTLLTRLLTVFFLASLLAACSGREIEAWDTSQFAKGNYRYYDWRSEPLDPKDNPRDEVYRVDPLLRDVVGQLLSEKGYEHSTERAQFNVDYLFAPGLQQGVPGDDTTNIYTRPGVVANRRIDGASVDNAHALAGVRETRSVSLQFNDVAATKEVWRVVVTEITAGLQEGGDPAQARRALETALRKAMKDLPPAAP